MIIDPFVGSGTTLVQAAELGINSIGIDISEFNCMISEIKTGDYKFLELSQALNELLQKTISFSMEPIKHLFFLTNRRRSSE